MLKLLGNFIPTPDTIQHERYLGDGPDGPQWAPAVARPGRWQRGSKRIQLADSRVVVLTAVCFLPGADGEVSTQDRLNGRTVEHIEAPAWLNGAVMHYEAGVV